MGYPLLSVVIPTLGERISGLERACKSVLYQQAPLNVEVIIVGDTLSRPLPDVETMVHAMGEPFRYVPHAGEVHCVGHPQRNRGVQEAQGDWICWMADDDIYTADAFQNIANTVDRLDKPRPLLFKVWMTHLGQAVWSDQSLRIGTVDAECIVVPNLPDKLGTWTNRYEGDADFIFETVTNFGGSEQAIWRTEVIAVARPVPPMDWTWKRELAGRSV